MKTQTEQSQSGHTPGRWYFRPEEPSVEAEHPNEPGFFCTVADCGKSRTLTPEQMQANARLIASAPETAAELERCRAVNRELASALAKCISFMEWAVNTHNIGDIKAENQARAALAAQGGAPRRITGAQ